MQLLEGTAMKYYIQDRLLLDIPSLHVQDFARIGLVGRNGSGKTTLLKILVGEVVADEGVIIPHTSTKLVPQIKQMNDVKSGGEITQQYLQQAFNHHAGLLLLDEPTTHLDQKHIEWLEKTLKDYKGALILVSHDRVFLDQLCTEIWEIDAGRLSTYKGNYTDYKNQKELERKTQQFAYEKYEKEKKKLEVAMREKEEKAQRATKKPKNLTSSEARLKGSKPYFANKQKKLRKTVSAFETRLAQLEKVEKPETLRAVQMDIMNEESIRGQIIIRAEQLIGRVGDRVLWKPANFYVRGGDKLAIIGANGAGKTTLLKKIIEQEVNVSPSVKIGYFAQNLTILDEEQTILENVQNSSKQSETFVRTVLARMHFSEDAVYKKVHVLSGGEKVKVALSKIFLSDVNVLVLDEPTNFLDIGSLEALEELLETYHGTVIFVTHDRMFTRKIATKILTIANQEITVFDGIYDAYEAHLNETPKTSNEDELLLLETKISDVLSRLSIEPSEELEEAFQRLLREKKALESKS